jgi:hypothetical protein
MSESASIGAFWPVLLRYLSELRFDLIGLNSILGEHLSRMGCEPYELRLRAAGKARALKAASMIPREVEALYTNGPAGGGGVAGSTREIVAIFSMLLPRTSVVPRIHNEVS